MKIKKKNLYFGVIIAIILVGYSSFLLVIADQKEELAKCLTEKGTTFFGAWWCPHCAEQKEKFGKAMRHVMYVECSLPDRSGSTQICIGENIDSYPTWEFPDKSRKSGVLELSELAARSGCGYA